LFTVALKTRILPFPTKHGIKIGVFTHKRNFKMSALATVKLCNLCVAHDQSKLLKLVNYVVGLACLYPTSMPAFAFVRIARFTICEIVLTAVHILPVNPSSVIQF